MFALEGGRRRFARQVSHAVHVADVESAFAFVCFHGGVALFVGLSESRYLVVFESCLFDWENRLFRCVWD